MTTSVPSDWPPSGAAGSIDLAVHDLPHASSTTEWWYVNTHLTTDSGRRASLFAAFFRVRLDGTGRVEDGPEGATRYSHFVTWALTDVDGARYLPTSLVDEHLPRTVLARLRAGRGTRDPRVNRAMQEILERGGLPLPDRRFDGPVTVSQSALALDLAGCRFDKLRDGGYRVELRGVANDVHCKLVFRPTKPVTRHGDDGVVRGAGGEDMFYYFIPRCAVEGTLAFDGREERASGLGWYDHEFGGHFRKAVKDAAETATATQGGTRSDQTVAWNWVALQLDDGTDVSASALYDVNDERRLAAWCIVSGPDGARHKYDDTTLEPLESWCSTRTFHEYPSRWRLHIPSAAIDLTLEAEFPDQEIITVVSKPAFWEGRMRVAGRVGVRAVSGLGYVERSGFEPITDLDSFFSAVSRQVRRSISALYPRQPTFDEVQALIASDDRPQYMLGVDPAQIGRALLDPVRDITDRGGKAWRSYAPLACCDVVLGDSRKHVKWLALPELMHVGSLIVDDVEDKSTVRRGGPASHLIHGEAKALNAGTAAYFMAQRLLSQSDVTPPVKLELYDLYFEALRAGHAGQAIDLDGLDGLDGPGGSAGIDGGTGAGGDSPVRRAVETGEVALLEERVLAVHRLKTAAPAGALARMGAVVGGGSRREVEAVGSFFEALGLAFQIIDDVLNLRGFRGDLKMRAEDLSAGKVTLPVVKALGALPLDGRRWLWKTLQSRSTDPAQLAEAVERLEAVGAIEACAVQARRLVEEAWAAADPVLPDSLYKIMLRAFGWYVLERHY